MATIGKTIKHMRQSLGMSQTQFAAKAQISFSTLSRIEGDKPVSDVTYGKCAGALGTTLANLKEEALKSDFVEQNLKKGETNGWEKVWIEHKKLPN